MRKPFVAVVTALLLVAGPAASQSCLYFIVEQGKWGLIDATGKVVVAPKYDQLGGIGATGENPFFERLPPRARLEAQLQEAPPLCEVRYLTYCIGGRCGVIKADGAEAVPARYEGMTFFLNGRAAIRRQGRWGYINEAGEEVVPPAYLSAEVYQDTGVALVQVAEEQWTLIDLAGRKLVEPPWPGRPVHPFFDDELVPQSMDGTNWGFMDGNGRWVIPATFQDCGRFTEGLAPAKARDKWGYVDPTGKWVVEPRFDRASVFFNANGTPVALVSLDHQDGLIDRDGRVRFLMPADIDFQPQGPPFTFRIPRADSHPPLASIRAGLVDATGRAVVEPRYLSIDGRSEGLHHARLAQGDSVLHVYLDVEGRVVVSGVGGGEFHEGLAQHIVESGEPMSVGKTGVLRSGSLKVGFIDRTGVVVMTPVFDEASDFAGGVARVRQGDTFSYIDRTGRILYSMRP